MLLLLAACTAVDTGAKDTDRGGTADTSDTADTADTPETADTAPAGPARAVWVWHPPWDEPEPFAAALAAGGFTEVWLADYDPSPDHHALVAAVRDAGVSPWALAGDPSWATGTAAAEHAAAIAEFNAAGAPYDGIQHDTEIHALPAFAVDPEQVTSDFVVALDGARAVAGVPLTVATAVWLDPAIFTEIAAHVDGIALMDYRDTVPRIEADAAEELDGTTPVWIGLELMEDPEGDTVSFYEEGHDALVAAMETVEADLAERPAFAGMAVHDWDAWETVP